AGWLGGIVFVGLAVYLLVDRTRLPPKNAHIIVDTERQTYASIPCVVQGHTDRELIKNPADAQQPDALLILQPYAQEARLKDMKERGETWHRDKRCNEARGFDYVEPFWRRLFRLQGRWTPEGEWMW